MVPRTIGGAMATEVSQALAGYAEGLFDQAAGRGQRAIDQVQSDLEQFARLLVHQVRLRKVLADPGLPPEPKRALLTDLGQGRTEMRLSQSGHLGAAQYLRAREGWSSFLDRIQARLAAGDR